MTDRLQAWVPEGVLAAAVLLLGLLEIARADVYTGIDPYSSFVLVVAFAVATLLCRKAPMVALAVVWAVGGLQLLFGVPVLTVEFAVAIVAFGCARWGRVGTVVLSGLSIPVAAVIGFLIVSRGSLALFRDVVVFRELIDSAYRFSDTLLVGAVILGLLTLAVPWLAGLVLRATARAQRSEVQQVAAEEDAARAQREALQAQEIAHLRDEQARLARDVHDVVGHSLAVILAQAESAQYLPDDPDKLKDTMATIATSARSSLQDVRQVLTTTADVPTPRPGGFDELVAGVRATGQEVVVDEVGAPRPLPPELEVVAYRVMQEMLTNAVKHGRRDRPIRVERHWPQDAVERDLRLEVANATPDLGETQPINAVEAVLSEPDVGGQGLPGMRRRVEAVGGRLDVRRRAGTDGPTFTTTVWVPVRA